MDRHWVSIISNVGGGLLWVCLAVKVTAAPNQTSSVSDAGGGRMSGGRYTLVHAVGQPGGVQVLHDTGGVTLQAGFINTFSLRPSTDTDADGVADELDSDNDNDGLRDEDEVSGSAFGGRTTTDPNNTDSDGDSSSDAEEAAAGTNPNDSTMCLEIVNVSGTAGGMAIAITWQAIAGKTYTLYELPGPDAGRPGTPVGTLTATGGVAPWYSLLTNQSVACTSPVAFYCVKLVP